MKGLFQCLLVALCSLNFALTICGDDSDFIDEKGKALRHLKGKMNYLLSSYPTPCGLTGKRKTGFSSYNAKKNLQVCTHAVISPAGQWGSLKLPGVNGRYGWRRCFTFYLEMKLVVL